MRLQCVCSTAHGPRFGQLRASRLGVGLALKVISAAHFKLGAEALQQLTDYFIQIV